MKRIWLLLFFSCLNLANAHVVEKTGFFQYREVFVEGDDCGEEYLDELAKSLNLITKDTLLRIRILNDLGDYYHTRNLNKALQLINQGLVEASRLNNRYWEGRLRSSSSMEPLELDVDWAIPIGLMVNELISNSLKYAFPGNCGGEITVKLEEKSNHLYLTVSDNGTGMQKKPEVLGSGFGSELIRLLTLQLDGKMALQNRAGTEFVFEFQT
jgi:signal transduction histidine kinase